MLEHLTAKDIPGRYKELVDNIGIEGFKYLVQMHGGTLFYIPTLEMVISYIETERLGKVLGEIIMKLLKDLVWVEPRFIILLMKNKRENPSYFIIFILFESLFILSVRLFSFPSILTSKYILIAIGNPTLATRVCKLESMVYKTKS